MPWVDLMKDPMGVCDVLAVEASTSNNILFENCNLLQCCVKLNGTRNVLLNRCSSFEDFTENGGTIGSALQTYGASGVKMYDSIALSPRALDSGDQYENLSFYNKSFIIDDASTGVEVTSSLIGYNNYTTVRNPNLVKHSDNVFLVSYRVPFGDEDPLGDENYITLGESIIANAVKVEEFIDDSGVDTTGDINKANFYIDSRFALDRESWDETYSTESLYLYSTEGVVESSESSDSSDSSSSDSSDSSSSHSSDSSSSDSSESASSDSSNSSESESSESSDSSEPASSDSSIGDFDGDGTVTVNDINLFVDKLLTQPNANNIVSAISIGIHARFSLIEKSLL